MSRQARLTEPSPLKLHALIDEAVVRRVVGSPAVMVERPCLEVDLDGLLGAVKAGLVGR